MYKNCREWPIQSLLEYLNYPHVSIPKPIDDISRIIRCLMVHARPAGCSEVTFSRVRCEFGWRNNWVRGHGRLSSEA